MLEQSGVAEQSNVMQQPAAKIQASVDRPDLLLSNSNPAAIRTRVKYTGGKAYLIGSNYSGQPASASFVWAGAVTSVSVYNEARQLPVGASSFSDSFGPYEARVYVIQ